MSLSVGIVGFPNVGKSTLFQAITKRKVDCSNYPFCTIEPNVDVVFVPDDRVDKLAKITHSEEKKYATVKFVDIAGLVKGAHKGEGLGNQFLAHIREVDAIIYILRGFKNEKIINIEGDINILRDKEILDTEMALKDLETIEKQIKDIERRSRTGDKGATKELEVLNKAAEILNKGVILESQNWQDNERKILKQYQFLTLKPRFYLLNGKQEEISLDTLKFFQKNNWRFLTIDLLSQFELSVLEPEERRELNMPIDMELDELIKEAYRLLGLITFFTTGPDETRAWTLKKNSTAPQAGGVIHSDFEKYFIKAEVINWQKLIKEGGFSEAKEKGLLRIEGKDYIVQEGDVIEIKSNA
ncbi:MAG: redox-regulated ATPase YchF [Patescibacteria group bacterium]|nr:redox-regulated ATPase YchF [Patescibacteria group bacterium]